jgi:hypothetical protein
VFEIVRSVSRRLRGRKCNSDLIPRASLLHRYSLLYSAGSAVAICKVAYQTDAASFGLKARRDIHQGCYIKETCSSMSENAVLRRAPSIIEGMASQLGKQEPRFILGPFRLVNHRCKPNAQVS